MNENNTGRMPLVSAIITTHNRCELLQRAIDAALNQTYHPMEVIVVDDASTDDTQNVCKRYGNRIIFIHISKEESRGGNHARNLGIKASHGEYCAFCDDDDCWMPDKTEKQMALMMTGEYELVHGGRKLEYIKPGGVEYKDTLPTSEKYGDMRKNILLTICATTTTTILANRKALFEVGLFDESLGFWQEYELTIRMAQRKPFGAVIEPLCLYRVDMQDAHRLTNKYFAWRKAVKYIRNKHKALYANLTTREKLQVNALVHRDAMSRSKASGLIMLYHYHHVMSFLCKWLNRFVK